MNPADQIFFLWQRPKIRKYRRRVKSSRSENRLRECPFECPLNHLSAPLPPLASAASQAPGPPGQPQAPPRPHSASLTCFRSGWLEMMKGISHRSSPLRSRMSRSYRQWSYTAAARACVCTQSHFETTGSFSFRLCSLSTQPHGRHRAAAHAVSLWSPRSTQPRPLPRPVIQAQRLPPHAPAAHLLGHQHRHALHLVLVGDLGRQPRGCMYVYQWTCR